jgi:alcohol dehydrogenase class IV
MSSPGFEFYTAGRIIFGNDSVDRLAELVPDFGRRALLVTGARFARETGLLARLEAMFPVGAVAQCEREPRIEDVDRAVAAAKQADCDVVVAVGGGAVVDCGKAAAGMMTNDGGLAEYLEGVGSGRQITEPAAPMIAVPTTAGTGSEVTKNAVITGPGYKKSVRSPLLIPRVAIVDPRLTCSAPPEVTASCGMDALAQVIEPYLSRNAEPMTDALALAGIRAGARGLEAAFDDPMDEVARENMALASLLGGICLANAGLGAVHGFASPLGALFPIPHGIACAAMLVPVIEGNLEAARGTASEDRIWTRFARVAVALTGRAASQRSLTVETGLEFLRELTSRLRIPRLGSFGIGEAEIDAIVAGSRGSSMRYNPIELSDAQLADMVRAAL